MEYQKSSPKDVFLHLLAIIALYISVGGLITLLFQYVNLFFPDQLNPYSYYRVSGAVRWAMASLVIVFPVYILVSWILYKDFGRYPEKRELKVRKWLINFTIFAASLILISDLVTLVYNFLGGDLTARFLLKVGAILLVIGSVFLYYFWDLKKQFTKKQLRIFLFSSVTTILVSVIAGFFTAGSPFTARLHRFDEQRINDLQILQNEVLNYWINKDVLPQTLNDMKNDISGFIPLVDPKSGREYEYTVKDRLTFELCADFELAAVFSRTQPMMPGRFDSYEQNWGHGPGRFCFNRTIDPEFYKMSADKNSSAKRSAIGFPAKN